MKETGVAKKLRIGVGAEVETEKSPAARGIEQIAWGPTLICC